MSAINLGTSIGHVRYQVYILWLLCSDSWRYKEHLWLKFQKRGLADRRDVKKIYRLNRVLTQSDNSYSSLLTYLEENGLELINEKEIIGELIEREL